MKSAIPTNWDTANLTSRERDLVQLVAQGYTDKEVATLLGISRDTVQTYWKRLKSKFNVSNRAQLVASLLSQDPATDSGDETNHESGKLEDLFALLDSMEDGIFVKDVNGIVQTANLGFRRMFGFSEEEGDLVGSMCTDLVEQVVSHFKDPEQVRANVQRLLDDRQPIENQEMEMVDGRTIFQSYYPFFRDGELVAHYLHYRDITNTIQSVVGENRLGSSFASIVESMPFALLCADRDGKITYLNQEGLALFPGGDSIFGAQFEDLFSDPGYVGLRRSFRAAAFEGQTKWLETPSLMGDGWFSMMIKPTTWGTLVCIRDISEERRGYRPFLQYVRTGEMLAKFGPLLIGATPVEIPGVLRRLIAEVGRQFGARRCTIQSLDSMGRPVEPAFEWSSAFGMPSPTLTFDFRDPQGRLWGEKLGKGDPILLRDVNDFELDGWEPIQQFRTQGTVGLILVPLHWNEETLGYLLLETPGAFKQVLDARMLSALRLIGQIVSGALIRNRC